MGAVNVKPDTGPGTGVGPNAGLVSSKKLASLFLGHGLGLRKSHLIWTDFSMENANRGTVKMMLDRILAGDQAKEVKRESDRVHLGSV